MPALFRSTNARALGREKVWQASSFSARYASVSTIVPAHFPQISSVPTSSRAHAIGSRRKKVVRMIRRLTRAVASLRGSMERKLLKPLRLVINRDLHVTSHRFSIPEGGNKFRPAEIRECSLAKSEKWRLFAQDFHTLQITGRVYF